MKVSFVNHAFNCKSMIIDGVNYPILTNSDMIVTLDEKEHNIIITNGSLSQVHLSILNLITLKSVVMSDIIVSAECDYKFKLQTQEDCSIEITDNLLSSVSENYNYSSYRASSADTTAYSDALRFLTRAIEIPIAVAISSSVGYLLFSA